MYQVKPHLISIYFNENIKKYSSNITYSGGIIFIVEIIILSELYFEELYCNSIIFLRKHICKYGMLLVHYAHNFNEKY